MTIRSEQPVPLANTPTASINAAAFSCRLSAKIDHDTSPPWWPSYVASQALPGAL